MSAARDAPLRKWRGALEKYKYALLVLAVGVVLLLLPTGGGGGEKKAAPGSETVAEAFDLEAFEEKLAGTLSAVDGAGEVRVVLTLAGGSRQVLAQDREVDGDGGQTSETVTLGRGSGEQGVVPLQTLAPSFRGALVVCPGGDDPAVRLRLTQAVASLTGLGSDHIAICRGEP